MESYSLFQLNEYIRRVIALNFREPLWIEAEIAQIRDSRGNQYLELVEKEEDGDDVIAQLSAAIWYRNFQFIKKKLGDLVYDLLVEGTQVRLKCTVDFHERYGIKLLVQDIDPNFTFGKLEIKRQEIINRLEEEGLMELNKALIIPDVIQRIAVISSENAAGYQDFQNQLTDNEYGYTFKADLFNSAVQGVKVKEETIAAIQEIKRARQPYHLVVIIRGGGSKLDLAGFDNYEIAKEIALSEIPFVIGIGHDIDSTVTDLVACLSLKTPTAVADYIIDRNMTFEARLEQSMAQLFRSGNELLKRKELSLGSVAERLGLIVGRTLSEEKLGLSRVIEMLQTSIVTKFSLENHKLEKMGLQMEAYDPNRILQRGYSYIKKGGVLIKSARSLKASDEIEIVLKDGTKKGKII